jgi:two-component system, chemotaxis family, protein-glutamate methylesterase/glutaminase
LSSVAESAADPESLPRRELVVIGASAGGVEALKDVVSGLPADLPAALCVVLHIAPTSPSALADILSRAGRLPCRQAEDGTPLRHGTIVVAPPDHHLIVEDNVARLSVGPRENGHRPSVDVLFRSAAAARHDQVVGVVLSGTRDDGAAGLAAIKASGGAAIVQDPDEAMYSGMPANALAHVAADAVVPSALIAQTLSAMARGEDPRSGRGGSRGPRKESGGHTLTSVCPDCGGVLTEENPAGVTQWECHVGHRYSPRSLADAQANRVEEAMWTAVRMLRDRSALLNRMADHAEARQQPRSARRFRNQAYDASDQAKAVLAALRDAAGNTLRSVADSDDVVEREAAS